MKPAFKTFAAAALVVAFAYHAIWILAAQALGGASLPTVLHLALLYVVPIGLLLILAFWMRIWSPGSLGRVSLVLFLIVGASQVGLQVMALLACQIQSECY